MWRYAAIGQTYECFFPGVFMLTLVEDGVCVCACFGGVILGFHLVGFN